MLCRRWPLSSVHIFGFLSLTIFGLLAHPTSSSASDGIYDVSCLVSDSLDEDRDLVGIDGTLDVNEPERKLFKAFPVRGSDDTFEVNLRYEAEDRVFSLTLANSSRQVIAQTIDKHPKRLYVFLGIGDLKERPEAIGIHATCTFKAHITSVLYDYDSKRMPAWQPMNTPKTRPR